MALNDYGGQIRQKGNCFFHQRRDRMFHNQANGLKNIGQKVSDASACDDYFTSMICSSEPIT